MDTTTVYRSQVDVQAPEIVRIQQNVLSLISELKPSAVLEIGCGTGILGSRIADLGCRYVGLEPVDGPYQVGRQSFPHLNLRQALCYDDPAQLRLGKFDLVFSNDVIEHLYLPRQLVSFTKAHLCEGGTAVCCTPDYGNYLRNLIISLTGRWDHHHTPLWDGGHIKFFSRRTLWQIFAEGGFTRFEWRRIMSIRVPLTPMSMICIAQI